MNPDISIVIPMRNEASYIGDTLASFRSVLDKSMLAHEIVVVDGASTDGSTELCGLADTVIVEREDERSSIARARNIGAAHSSGALLFHTDADVRLDPDLDFFEHVLKIFGDPEVVAVSGKIIPYPWSSRRLDRVWHAVGNCIIRRSHRVGVFFGRGEFQIVRASVFAELGGYNESITVGEDWDLFRRIAKHGTISYVPELFVYHSTRRFVACGYGNTLLTYLREFLCLVVLKRSYLKEWKVIR